MALKLTCITVGDHITTVSAVTKKGRNIHTYGQFRCATPEACHQDGMLTNPEQLAEVLKPELKRYSVKPRNLVFSIASSKIVSREVMLPSVKENRIPGIVKSNAGEYFPIDTEKYHVTYAKLDEVEQEGQKRIRIMAYAAPLTLLEPYFKLAKNLGGNIFAIDCASNGQYQALRETKLTEACLFVYIDTQNVFMTFSHQGRLMLQRNLPVGAGDYINEYMNLSAATPDQYIKTIGLMGGSNGKDFVSRVMSDESIAESLTRLASGVMRSINYFNQSYWETPVASILIGGPCAMLYGLRETIEKEVSLPVNFVESIVLANDSSGKKDPEKSGSGKKRPKGRRSSFWYGANVYINNIGAAIEPLDLIPEVFQVSRKKKKEAVEKKPSLRSGILFIILSVVSSLAMFLTSHTDLSDARLENQNVKNEIAKGSYIGEIIARHGSYSAAAEAMNEIRAQTDNNNGKLADFIDELEAKLPSDLIVLSMTCGQQSVTMNATASSKESVAALLVQLKSFESLGSVSMPSLQESADDTGSTYVSFSVTCYYK